MKQIHTTGACALFVLLLLVAPASAQSGENFSVGGIGGPGWPGALAALRIVLPVSAAAGFNIDVGCVSGHGLSYAGHIRLQWRERSETGVRPYFVIGLAHVKTSSRTTIVWPSQRRTVAVHDGPFVIPQFGLGTDWLSPEGVRVGIEGTTGGTEEAGPVVQLKFFVLWGPPSR